MPTAPPAPTEQPKSHGEPPRSADVRSSRLYLLSRGHLATVLRRVVSVLALVVLDVLGLALGIYAALVETGAGPLLAIPTTHSLGELARLALRPQKIRDVVVHGYFHDTDLLDPRRRRALAVALAVLGRRRTPGDLDTVAAAVRGTAAGIPYADIVRGRASGRPE